MTSHEENGKQEGRKRMAQREKNKYIKLNRIKNNNNHKGSVLKEKRW